MFPAATPFKPSQTETQTSVTERNWQNGYQGTAIDYINVLTFIKQVVQRSLDTQRLNMSPRGVKQLSR